MKNLLYIIVLTLFTQTCYSQIQLCNALSANYNCSTSSCQKISNYDFSCIGWGSPGCDFAGFVKCWRVSNGDPYYPQVCPNPNSWACYGHEACLIANAAPGYTGYSLSSGIYQNTTISEGKMYFVSLDYKVPSSINYNAGSTDSYPTSTPYGALDHFYVKFSDNNNFAANHCTGLLPNPVSQQTLVYLQNLQNNSATINLNACIKANDNFDALWIYSAQDLSSQIQSNIVIDNVLMFEADAGSDMNVCNEFIDLGTGCSTIPGATYSWFPTTGLSSTNTLNTILDASTLANGIHTYTLTINYNGCIISDDIVISKIGPFIDLGPDQLICDGTSFNLCAPAGFTNYQWSVPGGCPFGGNCATACQTGTYCVTVTDFNGCSAEDCVDIVISGPVTASILFGPTNTCPGEQVNLGVSTSCTNCDYLWSNGATTSSIAVYPTTSTTYSVILTNPEGCTASASQYIEIENCEITSGCLFVQRIDYDDNGREVQSTPDGGFVVIGHIQSIDGSSKDIYVVKYDANFFPEFFKKLFRVNYTYDEEGFSIAVTGNAYYVAGSTTTDQGSKDVYVAKIDLTGGIVWAKKFGGIYNDIATKIQYINNATNPYLLVTGYTNSFSNAIFPDYDMFALKLNTLGNFSGSPYLYVYGNYGIDEYSLDATLVSENPDQFVLTGYSFNLNSNTYNDVVAIKINSNLTLSDDIRIDGDYNEVGRAVVKDGSSFIIAGNTTTYGNGGSDIYLVRINTSNMAVLNHKTFGTSRNEIAYDIIKTKDNNFAVAGTYALTSSEKSLALKIDGGFNIISQKISNESKNNGYYSIAELYDGDNFAMTGYFTPDNDREIFITKTSFDLESCCLIDFNLGFNNGIKITKGINHFPKEFNTAKHLGEVPYLFTDHICAEYTHLKIQNDEQQNYPQNSPVFVYPSPTESEIYVKFNSELDTFINVQIFDISGKEINVEIVSVNDSIITLDVTYLKTGFYILKAISSSGSSAVRFLKN